MSTTATENGSPATADTETETDVVARMFGADDAGDGSADDVTNLPDVDDLDGWADLDDDEPGWSGPTEQEWYDTRDAIYALAEQQTAGEAWGSQPTLDPFDDDFDLGAVLDAHGQTVVGQVMQVVEPFVAAAQAEQLRRASDRIDDLLDEAGVRGNDRQMARDLASAELTRMMHADPTVADNVPAIEQAIRAAGERVGGRRGGRAGRATGSRQAGWTPAETETEAVMRVFGER